MLYTTSYVASCLSSSQEEGQGEQDQETDSPRPLGIPNDQITIDIVGVRVMKVLKLSFFVSTRFF